MPKIPEFQRQRLASSRTGTPGADTFGATVSRAVTGLATQVTSTVGQIAFKRKQVKDAAFTAKSAVDFDLGAEATQQTHSEEFGGFRGDPRERTQALRDKLTKQLDDQLAGIDSADVRLNVSRLGQGMIQARVLKESAAASSQQAVLAFDDVMDATRSQALAARQAGRAGDFNRLAQLLVANGAVRGTATGLLSPENNVKLGTEAPKSIVTGFALGLNEVDPAQVIAAAEAGKFGDVFTPEELQAIVDDAHAKAEGNDVRADKDAKEASGLLRFSYVDRIAKGSPPSAIELQTAVDRGFDPSDAEDILLMVRNAPPLDSDQATLIEANRRLVNGTLDEKYIIENHQKLATTERERLIRLLTSKIEENPSVKRAFNLLDAEINEQAFGVLLPDDEFLLNSGQDEVIERALRGENPLEVVEGITTRMRRSKQKAILIARGIRLIPGEVTKDSVELKRADTVQRFVDGKIPQEESDAILNQLTALEATL